MRPLKVLLALAKAVTTNSETKPNTLSLRLLASDKAADEFKDKVFGYLGDDLNLIDPKARSFWNSA